MQQLDLFTTSLTSTGLSYAQHLVVSNTNGLPVDYLLLNVSAGEACEPERYVSEIDRWFRVTACSTKTG
ncbi:MAG: hypothetical protein ABR590_04065, partial [Spirochaetia bacterium]